MGCGCGGGRISKTWSPALSRTIKNIQNKKVETNINKQAKQRPSLKKQLSASWRLQNKKNK